MASNQQQPPGGLEAKIVPSEAVPGMMEKVAPLLPEDIPNPEKIGRKRNETQEIRGHPITPEDAAEITAAEQAAGADTRKGSLSARMQSAAAVNVREGIVPPVGTAPPGTDRGVLSGPQEQAETFQHIQHSTKSTRSGGPRPKG